MRPHLLGIGMVLFGLVGILRVSDVFTHVQIYTGVLHGDGPDPDRPGHLKGAVVTLPELVIHTTLTIACLAITLVLWRRLRKLDVPSTPPSP